MKHFMQTEEDDPSPRSGTPTISSAEPIQTEPQSSLFKVIRNKIYRFLTPKHHSLEDEVVEFIEENDPEGTQIGSEERTMLHNVLNLGETKVRDVMIPRSDIIAVKDDTSLDELKEILREHEHTRIPVYNESTDNIIGFVHIKSLIPYIGQPTDFKLLDVLHNILYVAPSMKILDLLVSMRDQRIHMAIVLDEYGVTDGLLTMEDLMEEIVGEIEDEHDDVEPSNIVRLDGKTFEVSARTIVEELEETLQVHLRQGGPEEDFDTIGGLIFFMLGRVPDQGEIIPHLSGVEFKIIEADKRRIKKLLVRTN